MTIEGIDSVDHIGRVNKTDKAKPTIPQRATDSVEFSTEAQTKAEFEHAKALVHEVANSRADRIAHAKQNIHDLAYLKDPKVIDTIADRIADLFLG